MNKNFENFELTIKMYPDYDTYLFEEDGNGNLKTTSYFKYVAVNFMKEYFKDLIQSLDTNHDYFKLSTVTGIDPNEFNALKDNYHKEHADVFKLIEEDKKAWREEHKDFYRIQPSLPSSNKYKEIFLNSDFFVNLKNINSNDNITLDEAIQGYKYSNELLKTISNESLDRFCTELKPMLNYEHKSEYNEAVIEITHKHGLLTDQELKETLKETTFTKTRLSLNRQKSNNSVPFNSLADKMFDKLTSTLFTLPLI